MKIKRKFSKNEKRIMLLTRILNIADLYLKDRGLVEDFKAWNLEKQKGGGDNGMQGNGKEGVEGSNEGKDGGCCGEDSCCKEGKEEVGLKVVNYRCPQCRYNSIDNPGSILIAKEGRFFCPRCNQFLDVQELEGVG